MSGESQIVSICVGFYKPGGVTSCIPCKSGYFQIHRGRTKCRECPVGFYCPVGIPKAIVVIRASVAQQSKGFSPLRCEISYSHIILV